MTLKQILGLDTRAERYTYGNDPAAGYVSAQKVPDRWVATTCRVTSSKRGGGRGPPSGYWVWNWRDISSTRTIPTASHPGWLRTASAASDFSNGRSSTVSRLRAWR